jgi:hypothetical protein
VSYRGVTSKSAWLATSRGRTPCSARNDPTRSSYKELQSNIVQVYIIWHKRIVQFHIAQIRIVQCCIVQDRIDDIVGDKVVLGQGTKGLPDSDYELLLLVITLASRVSGLKLAVRQCRAWTSSLGRNLAHSCSSATRCYQCHATKGTERTDSLMQSLK